MIQYHADLGFAMHPNWLGGGTAAQFLEPLRALGVTALEFTLEPAHSLWPTTTALVSECQGIGFTCHFHAPYADPYNPAGWLGGRREEIEALCAPALDFADARAAANRRPTVLVVHGARGTASRADLTADTVAFLSWVLSRTPSLSVTLELLPREPGKYKVGETASGVMEVLRRVGSPRLAACLDLGHVARNALLGDDAPLPRGFLRQVRHVHVHDVNGQGEDHYPLIYGNVPIARYLRPLERAGYAGAVILELNGHHLASLGGDSGAMIRESLRRLRE